MDIHYFAMIKSFTYFFAGTRLLIHKSIITVKNIYPKFWKYMYPTMSETEK